MANLDITYNIGKEEMPEVFQSFIDHFSFKESILGSYISKIQRELRQIKTALETGEFPNSTLVLDWYTAAYLGRDIGLFSETVDFAELQKTRYNYPLPLSYRCTYGITFFGKSMNIETADVPFRVRILGEEPELSRLGLLQMLK